MSGTQRAELRSDDSPVVLRATWSCPASTGPTAKSGCNLLHLTVEPPTSKVEPTIHPSGSAFNSISCSSLTSDGKTSISACRIQHSGPALSFLWSTVAQASGPVSLRFVLPEEDGYIVRSDFIEESLRGCSLSATAHGFVKPGQHCTTAPPCEGPDGSADYLLNLLHSSVGVIVAKDGETLQALDDELQIRLSWPWTIPTPVGQTRVVMICEKRRAAMCQNFYAAARGCGVEIVVFDNPGHWMEDDNGRGPEFREHFVPFTVSGCALADLPQRIVDKIRTLPYTVDGIITTTDTFLPGIARAAEILGLPTLGAEAYRRGTDKYETRQLSQAPTAIKVENLEAFLAELQVRAEPLQYPLIVKPTRSHGSEGVSRVENEDELIKALHFAFGSLEKQHRSMGLKYGGAPVIVETYCEGPEVDVNMLLWNGELLHSEVTDNFPCLGDSAEASSKTFGCTGSIFPSALPQEELDMLQQDVLSMMLKLGLHSGVIHAEAKVHNSASEVCVDQNGVYDLQPRSQPVAGRRSTFLLEVNPRPAGLPEVMGSIYTYGVDYFASHLMYAIGDEARFRSLARGFQKKPLHQYAWVPQAIDIPTSGRMPKDLGLDKLNLHSSYADHWHFWKGGEVVPVAKERPWPGLGFMMFKSLTSRKDVLQKATIGRDLLQFNLD